MIRLRVTIGGRDVDIPASAWGSLYDPTLETCDVWVNAGSGCMYIRVSNYRDAAGGYEMVWIFKNGQYVKRYIDQSNN